MVETPDKAVEAADWGVSPDDVADRDGHRGAVAYNRFRNA